MSSASNKRKCVGNRTIVNTSAITLLHSLITAFAYGQMSPSKESPALDSTVVNAKPKPLITILNKVKMSGTIRMRYTASLDKNIGIDGTHHSPDSTQFTTNAFTIPQARLLLESDITDKLDVTMRANFGDFAYSPQSRVLEYAYGTYHFNPIVNVRMGLFRPWFGWEDDLATDFLKSFDYSNLYRAFDENGWMGFQMGVSVFGAAKISDIPLRYYTGVFNGNSRNNFTDNDNGKQFPARIEMDLTKELEVGISGGLGKELGVNISVWGADFNYEKELSSLWKMEIESEYKQGNNQSLFFKQAATGKTVGDYQMRGVYVLPSIQYKIKGKQGLGLEASFKYENLNLDFKQNGNVRQQYVPMLGIDFADQYAVRLQVGAVLDRYDRNVENSTEYNSNRFITQLQLRF